MTEAMPFLQKAILLSYAPRPFFGVFYNLSLFSLCNFHKSKLIRPVP